MKLSELFEKINNSQVIDNGDLTMIMNAVYKADVKARINCFVKAAVEAIRILTKIKVSMRDVDDKAKDGARKGSEKYDKIHPDTVKKVAAKGVSTDDGQTNRLHLEYTYMDSKDEIKAMLKKGVPVILSIVWTDLIFYPVVYITRPTQKDRISKYVELGADEEMMHKVTKESTVPYPNDALIKKSKEENDPHAAVKHALLAIGYNASKKCFICRDYSIYNGSENGVFNLDERILFDHKLKSEGLSTVEMALAIEVDHVKD